MVKMTWHGTEEGGVPTRRRNVHARSHHRFPGRRKALKGDLAGWRVLSERVVRPRLHIVAGIAMMRVMTIPMTPGQTSFAAASGMAMSVDGALVLPLMMFRRVTAVTVRRNVMRAMWPSRNLLTIPTTTRTRNPLGRRWRLPQLMRKCVLPSSITMTVMMSMAMCLMIAMTCRRLRSHWLIVVGSLGFAIRVAEHRVPPTAPDWDRRGVHTSHKVRAIR